ncbi:MAG: GntR family transcriptional regulator, partial [Sediminibacterium sp.]
MKKTVSFLFILCLLGFGMPESNPRIFLIGDSTMADKPLDENPERGWGQLLPKFLLPGIQVQN